MNVLTDTQITHPAVFVLYELIALFTQQLVQLIEFFSHKSYICGPNHLTKSVIEAEEKMSKRILSLKLLLFTAFVLASLVFVLLQNALVTRTIVSSFEKIYLVYSRQFDPERNVLVFLHIQKTGGSDFDRAIVKHLQVRKRNVLANACEKTVLESTTSSSTVAIDKKIRHFKQQKFKKFKCVMGSNSSENWYFSRQTFGWICGLHPDYTDLSKCVRSFYPHKNPDDFIFFTILREPFRR